MKTAPCGTQLRNVCNTLRILVILFLSFVVQPASAGPQIAHWTATSGAQVFFVENHDLPILDVQIDFTAGTAYDPAGKAGLAGLTRGLLDLGVAGMDEAQIANRLADLGANLTGGVDMDRSSVALRTVSAADKRIPALDILRAVLVSPRFPNEVFEREKARTLAMLKEALTRPEVIASKTFWQAMYPAHPYGVQSTIESVTALTRDDLPAFYNAHYDAHHATLAIVGDVTRAEAEAIAEQLTTALPPSKEITSSAPPALPIASEQHIAHPAAQAHILIGLPSIKRGDPDFFPLLVGNYTLGGGGFVSRLMQEVRDKRGLAYDVHSYFHPLAFLGPFQIGLQTKKTQAKDALQLTRKILGEFLDTGPSVNELQAAKKNLIGSFPLRLDSNRKILENVAVIGFYHLPLDYLDRYAANIEKVTVTEVKAAFARHVSSAHLVTVVVGDAQ